MSVVATLAEIRTWPINQRFDYLFQIWDDVIEQGLELEISPEMQLELDRRLASFDADPSNVRTWEQIEQRLQGTK